MAKGTEKHIKYGYMNFPSEEYCGDAEMSEYLAKAGSRLDIHGLYGLFYGCLAAPCVVMPSRYLPVILGDEEPFLGREDESKEMIANAGRLWNILARWRPERGPFIFPDTEYVLSGEGLEERVTDDISLISYFIEGLDLGGACEDDLSEEGLDALKYLSEADIFLDKYIEVAWAQNVTDEMLEKTFDLIEQLEDILVDCIAGISVDLQDVKCASRERGTLHIGGDELCPCGSGRRYEKCCGLTH